MKFKVGEVVIMRSRFEGSPGWEPEMEELIGKTGTVLKASTSGQQYYISNEKGLNQGYYSPGWWWPPEALESFKPEPEERLDRFQLIELD